MANDPTNPIRAVEHTLTVLKTLKQEDGARVSELEEHLDLSKSTIHNHLATLRQNGYVVKERDTYYVGLRWLGLGGYARDRLALYRTAKPTVDELANQTHELALVTTEVAGRSMYLYQARGEQAVTTDSYLGIELPMHCTGTGKAMLASMPDEKVDRILEEHGLPERTENTITDREEMFEALETIREQEYALDDGERIKGMRGIGVPLRSEESGELFGALSITGPANRIKGEYFRSELPELIHRAAREIEINMTFQ